MFYCKRFSRLRKHFVSAILEHEEINFSDSIKMSTYLLLSITGNGSSEGSALEVENSAIGPPPKYYEDGLQATYGDIIYSTILFRHGDRYPNHTFPEDPNTEYLKKAGMGLLADKGRQRAYRLGLWARARYAKLLKDQKIGSGFLNVISSEMERTINSTQLFLAGFYPPDSKNLWNTNIPWFPVAVYPIKRENDNVLSLKAHCPRFNAEMEHLRDTSDMKSKIYEKYDEEKFFKYIEKHSGMEIPRNDAIKAINKLQQLYDSLYVQDNLGLGYPEWAKEVFPDTLREFATEYFSIVTHNEITKRLKGGPLTERIIHSMKLKRDNEPECKNQIFQLYGGHDMTLATIMNSWGIWDRIPPPYSSALFIELRNKNGNYNVTILYRTSDENPPKELKIPTCGDPCTLDDFINQVHDLVPDNWREECLKLDPDYDSLLF